jgi:hypothetical protein
MYYIFLLLTLVITADSRQQCLHDLIRQADSAQNTLHITHLRNFLEYSTDHISQFRIPDLIIRGDENVCALMSYKQLINSTRTIQSMRYIISYPHIIINAPSADIFVDSAITLLASNDKMTVFHLGARTSNSMNIFFILSAA